MIALVGNPNCGKTTLFNALTGARQKVGNWPGVTVEKKTGFFVEGNQQFEVTDLPGIYSLNLSSEQSLDERIACEYLLAHPDHIVINIVDASNLERHLYLTVQLLEAKVPLILALNMMDVAHSRGMSINTQELSQRLGCPVVVLTAHKGQGVKDLKKAIQHFKTPHQLFQLSYAPEIQTAVQQLAKDLESGPKHATWTSLCLLEDDTHTQSLVSPTVLNKTKQHQALIASILGEDADILIADTRYRFITDILQVALKKDPNPKKTWTHYIDTIVLNRLLGVPIFLGIMYLLFFFSINIGGAFQDFFDISSETIFVTGLAHVLNLIGSPVWLTALLASGVGKGINTTITFVPVIGAMFLFLAVLEDSGYMARAAFVIDRFMRALGLPGKAFVLMIVGFGCNVPAIMAARNLENHRDRILTIMMSPFMSCGARLAIYAVFTTAFFPQGGQNIIFALYLIGIFMAVITGFILRHTFLRGDPSPLIMELPTYHVPHLKTIGLHAWQRLKGFVFRAGKLIVPICVLIGALNAINLDGSIGSGDGSSDSLLSVVGRFATPIFAPLGLQSSNWPATVGLLTGILAKEVVVGTLNTLYTQMGHLATVSASAYSLLGGLQEAFQSIVTNFAQLGHALENPVLAKAPIDTLDQSVYGLMYQQFDGKAGAFAYLLFVLLYFPCVSTTAVMLKELNRAWSIFSALWTTGIAYGVAVVFYQAATFSRHPGASALWISGVTLIFVGVIGALRWFVYQKEQKEVSYEFN